MIFHDTLELNLKVGDKVMVMEQDYPLEIKIHSVGSGGYYLYNADYTVYGFYYHITQKTLFRSNQKPQFLFKKLICNNIKRIIPI